MNTISSLFHSLVFKRVSSIPRSMNYATTYTQYDRDDATKLLALNEGIV